MLDLFNRGEGAKESLTVMMMDDMINRLNLGGLVDRSVGLKLDELGRGIIRRDWWSYIDSLTPTVTTSHIMISAGITRPPSSCEPVASGLLRTPSHLDRREHLVMWLCGWGRRLSLYPWRDGTGDVYLVISTTQRLCGMLIVA